MLYCPRSTDCSRFLRFRCLANGELSRILNGRSLRSQHQLRFCSHRSDGLRSGHQRTHILILEAGYPPGP